MIQFPLRMQTKWPWNWRQSRYLRSPLWNYFNPDLVYSLLQCAALSWSRFSCLCNLLVSSGYLTSFLSCSSLYSNVFSQFNWMWVCSLQLTLVKLLLTWLQSIALIWSSVVNRSGIVKSVVADPVLLCLFCSVLWKYIDASCSIFAILLHSVPCLSLLSHSIFHILSSVFLHLLPNTLDSVLNLPTLCYSIPFCSIMYCPILSYSIVLFAIQCVNPIAFVRESFVREPHESEFVLYGPLLLPALFCSMHIYIIIRISIRALSPSRFASIQFYPTPPRPSLASHLLPNSILFYPMLSHSIPFYQPLFPILPHLARCSYVILLRSQYQHLIVYISFYYFLLCLIFSTYLYSMLFC